MKRQFMIHWKKSASILAVVVVGMLIYLPSFKLHFSLLDDGLTILKARLLMFNLLHLDWGGLIDVLLEPLNGRVRPGYWLIQSIFSWLSFYNSQILHFWRVVILASTVILSYSFMSKLKIRHSIILLSVWVFLFNIQNFENYYRLGPVEPLIIFLLVAIFYLIFVSHLRHKITILCLGIFMILGGLIKENFFFTSLALLPALILAKVKKDKKVFNNLVWILLFGVISGVIILIIKLSYPTVGVYSSNYNVTLSTILNNIWSYVKLIQFNQTPLFEISVIHFVFFTVSLFKKGVKKIDTGDVVLISLWSNSIIQLLVLTPWNFVLNRYLAFININLIFIYAISLNDLVAFIFSRLPRLRGFGRFVILCILFLILTSKIFVRNFFSIANYQLYAQTDSDVSYDSVKAMAEALPVNVVVYVNYKKGDSNIEIFEETKWHLGEFYSRRDIEFVYLDSINLCTKQSRFIFDRRSDRFLASSVFADKNKFKLVKGGASIYSPINYGIVVKSFIDRYRYTGWSDEYDFDWGLYLQKEGTCIENVQ
ncbi:TPA: hypothetical protein DIU22_01515 [Candidatus Woesebacteria bacterium]|nr:hypothetical protein [Candidatus Woesebacteria bacterium]